MFSKQYFDAYHSYWPSRQYYLTQMRYCYTEGKLINNFPNWSAIHIVKQRLQLNTPMPFSHNSILMVVHLILIARIPFCA